MKIKQLITVALAIALVAVFAGCSSKKPVEQKITQPVYLKADPAALLHDLQVRNNKIHSLLSRGNIEYRFTDSTAGYRGTDFNFATEKPGKVYARGKATAVGTVFTLKTDGETFWAELTREEKVYTGSVNSRITLEQDDGEEMEFVGINPGVLAEALLIDDLTVYSHAVFAILPDLYIIDLLDDGEGGGLKLRRRIWIERGKLTVRRHHVFNNEGELTTEANLFDYQDIDGVLLPRVVIVERKWEKLSIRIALDEIRLNPDLNPDLFHYDAPAGYEVIKIDEKVNEDAKSGKSESAGA